GFNTSISGGMCTANGMGVVVDIHEVRGGFLQIANVEMQARNGVAASISNRGLIYMFTAPYTTFDPYLQIKDCSVLATSAITTSTPFCRVTNGGSTTARLAVIIDGVDFSAPIMGSILHTSLSSGTANARMIR